MRRVVTSACIKLEDTPLLVPVVDRYGCNGRLAIELCEVEPEEGDDGLWRDLTVNLPQYGLPGDDWAFVPEDGLPYARALEAQGLAEVGRALPYGRFGQLAWAARFDLGRDMGEG